EDGAVEDIDSTPDTDAGNDAGGAVGTPSDDATTGDGSGAPGDTEENTDEDDADPALISIGEFDLALTKVLTPGQDPVVEPGDEVSFTITVENQGEVTADNIEVTDYLPTGLSLSANATGWTDNGDGTATFAIEGELAPGASTTITILVTVDAGTDGEDLVNVAEISAATDSEDGAVEDIDSTPDTDDGNDAGGAVGTPSDDATTGDGTGAPGDTEENTDEDDADPALISIGEFDLALTKVLSAGQDPVVEPGDEVSFTITVENQGEVTADNIEVTDYLPTGLSLSANATGWTDNGDGTATFAIEGELAPGASTTITILVTVDAGTDGEDLVNVAEISAATDSEDGAVEDIDSTPDTDDGNDAGGAVGTPSDDATTGDGTGAPGDTEENTDEDDADPALISIGEFDLALTKVLSAGQDPVVEPGDEVSFTITVENQGEVTADNIEVTDYLPTGLSLSANATGWTDNGDGTATFAIEGELAPGASTTITILVTVDAGTDGEDLVNVAEISAATDSEDGAVEDIDSTPDTDAGNDAGGAVGTPSDDATTGDGSGAPGDTEENTDEDDADPALISIGEFDLALTKVLTPGQDPVVEPGDEVSFTITVENQGEVTADNIEVTDYLPTGLSLSANATGWTDNG
ncbi:DUF11 domain-containing protein, partial [Lewinella sp. W8]